MMPKITPEFSKNRANLSESGRLSTCKYFLVSQLGLIVLLIIITTFQNTSIFSVFPITCRHQRNITIPTAILIALLYNQTVYSTLFMISDIIQINIFKWTSHVLVIHSRAFFFCMFNLQKNHKCKKGTFFCKVYEVDISTIKFIQV